MFKKAQTTKLTLGILVSLVFLFILSCQTGPKPVVEYSLARAAMEAARAVEAPRYAPGFWNQAEESFRKARMAFRNQEWQKSKELFEKSRLAAEKAETSSRVSRMKSGEVL